MAYWTDFERAGSGYSGIDTDPWGWSDFSTWLATGHGADTVWARGTINKTGVTVFNTGGTVTLRAWDLSQYGPWRLKCNVFQGAGSSWYLYDGILFVDTGSYWINILNNSFFKCLVGSGQLYAPLTDSTVVGNYPSLAASTVTGCVLHGVFGNTAPPGWPSHFSNSVTDAANIAALAVGGGGGVDDGGMVYGASFPAIPSLTSPLSQFNLYDGYGPSWAKRQESPATPLTLRPLIHFKGCGGLNAEITQMAFIGGFPVIKFDDAASACHARVYRNIVVKNDLLVRAERANISSSSSS